ncbi:MAG: hypothetical protein HOB13_12295 [Lentimicrobiaceae bacterium]|nr:hypothetical protein [Lentimicrobiaceae bacterium]
MIVCEIGLNHNGDTKYADKYLDFLLQQDIDAITFQIREPEFYLHAEKSHLSLSLEYYSKARDKVRHAGKKIGIALSDISLLSFFESINIDFYKIIRNDPNDKDFLNMFLSATNKSIFISTGMCSIERIDEIANYNDNRISLIHTQLSNDINNVNLTMIKTLQNRYNQSVAYGHHCENINVLYLSLTYNISDIFFYVKGNMLKYHPDENHAVQLDNITDIVSNLKTLPLSIGNGVKLKTSNTIKGQDI